MKRIPEEMDRLLWSVAEQHDPRAFDEFAERYPAYKADLIERAQLVRSLRAARPDKDAPRLSLPQMARRAERSRTRTTLVLCAFGLAAASFAFINVYMRWNDRPVKHESVPPVRLESSGQGDTSAETHTAPRMPLQVTPGSAGTNEPRDPQPVVEPDPFNTVVTVVLKNSKLSTVVEEISRQAKLKLEVAPGMQDDKVTVRFVSVTAKEALEDLGQNFGFSVVVEEGNHALLIPAIDNHKAPSQLPGGSYSEPSSPPGQPQRQAKKPDLGSASDGN